MWGTSSPGDKLTGDFGNEPDATSISDRGLFRLLAGNLSPGVFRLLQHNLPTPDIAHLRPDCWLGFAGDRLECPRRSLRDPRTRLSPARAFSDLIMSAHAAVDESFGRSWPRSFRVSS